MEERLFWIGLTMGLYAWGTRFGVRSGKLDSRLATSAWHSFFMALAGFAATLVAVMSIESRSKFQAVGAGALSSGELRSSLIGAAVLGAFGFANAWRKGKYQESRQYYQTEDLEWAETVFSAVLLAAVMMYFIVQAFKIPSGSMRSTLLEGDHLFVNKFIYGVRLPYSHKRILRLRPIHRGDIIVFRFPDEDLNTTHCGGSQYGKDFIKRVIGLPGDEVKVLQGQVYVNGGKLAPEPYAQYLDNYRQPPYPIPFAQTEYQRLWSEHQLDHTLGDVMRDEFGPVKIPEGYYFAMGDNRDRSCDSRFWGPVPGYDIKGKAWMIYWPPARMGEVH